MDSKSKLCVFKAQTQYAKELLSAQKQLNKSINNALRKNDSPSAKIHTKVLALIFCAWAEANFSKLIHTPYGFTLDEIAQIKTIWKSNGLESGWNKCLELGLKKVGKVNKGNFLPNVKQKIVRIIYEFVVEPSLIRNKIAHGQWKVALNRKNDAENNNLTNEINTLDSTKLLLWFEAHRILSNIIEMIIESPKKAFIRDYWTEIVRLESILDEKRKYSLEDKIKKLQQKKKKQTSNVT